MGGRIPRTVKRRTRCRNERVEGFVLCYVHLFLGGQSALSRGYYQGSAGYPRSGAGPLIEPVNA